MTIQVGWGIIGTSSWADTTFGPAIAAAENARFVGAAGRDPDRTAEYVKKHGAETAFSSIEQLLDDDRIEAVWIATPNHLHAGQAFQALGAGKHVLVEKPMGLSVNEAAEMQTAAEQAGKLLSIGYHIRHHPVHQEIHRRWMAGEFGKPVQVRAHLFFAYPQLPAEWRRDNKTSGDWVLGDIGTHLIDLLVWFLGKAEDVQGYLAAPRFQLETSDHGVVVARFDSGGVGIAEASTGAPGMRPSLEIYGTEGFAVLEGTMFGSEGTLTTGDLNGSQETRKTEVLNLYQAQVESFSRAVTGEGALLVRPEDGIENMNIIEKARGW